MTTLDLHPEELFDKAARGELSDSERALLDAHLAQCAVCRFERQVVQDFAAMPAPALDVDQLVTKALTARTSDTFTARRAAWASSSPPRCRCSPSAASPRWRSGRGCCRGSSPR